MGACQRRSLLFLVLSLHTINSVKMVDNVETTTPTVEEVATNGESETATDEVKEVTAAASENGANGTHEAEKNGEAKEAESKEAESTNGTEAEAKTEEAEKEAESKEDEATKRKADAPSEDETSEKIAKLKE